MKLRLLILFTLFTSVIFAQNLPTGQVWGNTKVKATTSANDTSGSITLDQIKTYTTAGLAGGTVTSVAVSVPAGLSVSNSPITSTGTIAISNNLGAGFVSSSGVGGSLTSSATIPTTALSGTVTNAQLTNSSITGSLTATGTDLTLSSSTALGGTLTLNVPDASATARGVITTGSQIIAGTKNFNGLLAANVGFVQSGNHIETLTGISIGTTLTTSSNKHQVVDATSAAVTVTLPSAPQSGTTFIFTKKNTSTNYVTLTRGGTDTIMGNTSHVIVSGLSPVSIVYNAGMWYLEN
jgi:hypothetical protein